MARDSYRDTMTLADAASVLKALSGIQVSVYLAGTTTLATIYQARTGATQGPVSASGAVGGPNPFMTGPTGAIEFYADVGEYDVAIEDTQVPERIATRSLGWASMPAADGGIPTSKIAGDAATEGGIALASLGGDVVRQMTFIGEKIEWWRPDSSVPLPDGCEIADGRTIPAGSHDFPVAGDVTLPDLRNKFILGADSSKAHGAVATGADGSANGPGINGVGGSHQVVLSVGQLAAHGHAFTTGGENSSLDHGHGLPFWAAARNGGSAWTAGMAQQFSSGVGLPVPVTFGATSIGEVGNTNIADMTPHSHSGTSNNTGSGQAHNNMPNYVGLLMLIKVRRS